MRQTPSGVTQPLRCGMTKVYETLVMGMHLVIDPYNHCPVISEIGHPYPCMHGQGIAGGCQFLLGEDLVRIGLTALKFIGVIAGYPILYFRSGGLVMVLWLGKDSVPNRSLFPAQDGYGKQNICKQPGFDFF